MLIPICTRRGARAASARQPRRPRLRGPVSSGGREKRAERVSARRALDVDLLATQRRISQRGDHALGQRLWYLDERVLVGDLDIANLSCRQTCLAGNGANEIAGPNL